MHHSSWSSFQCQCQCSSSSSSSSITSRHLPMQQRQQQQQQQHRHRQQMHHQNVKCGNRTSGLRTISSGGLVNSPILYCVTVIVVIVSTLMTTASTGSLSNPIGPGRKCPQCVQGLSGEPDYRAVKLSWKYLHSQEPPAFKVKYCEISQWQGKIRCRQKLYPLSIAIQGGKSKWIHLKQQQSNNAHPHHLSNDHSSNEPSPYLGKLIRLEKGSYQAAITDLRMNTNYTINVEADFYGTGGNFGGGGKLAGSDAASNSRDFSPYQPSTYETFPIMVETKGFTGKTIRCLGNQSEVVVNTGPYFNGKISVEGANDESCVVYGNKSSSLEAYTIKINHVLCGSKIVTNNSSVETMIMVHENREILTHNSRRFLVICQFNPETYTFTASADVPSYLLKRKKLPSASTSASSSPNHQQVNSGSSSGSSSSLGYGPTGTKPLTNSKDLLVDETSVPSFHEYATSVTSSLPPYYSPSKSPSQNHMQRDSPIVASAASPGTSTSTTSSTTESRNSFFKLRSPLTSVTRASDSHASDSSHPPAPVNLDVASSSSSAVFASSGSTNDAPNYVDSSYRSSDVRNFPALNSGAIDPRDSRILSAIGAANYHRNILTESESHLVAPLTTLNSDSSDRTSSLFLFNGTNNELYSHLILAATVLAISTLAVAICYFKCVHSQKGVKGTKQRQLKFNDQLKSKPKTHPQPRAHIHQHQHPHSHPPSPPSPSSSHLHPHPSGPVVSAGSCKPLATNLNTQLALHQKLSAMNNITCNTGHFRSESQPPNANSNKWTGERS